MAIRPVLLLLNGVWLSALGRFYHAISNRIITPATLPGLLATGLLFFIFELVLLVLTYRAIWHPLAKYPGPWWAALTDWYSVYHIVKGDRHIDFHRLHEKYGKIVRFGPRRISVRSATALNDIYSVNANVKRSQVYASTADFFGGTPSSNTTPDMREHAFRRRVNVRALNPANVKGLEEQILKNIRVFCETLPNGKGDAWSSPHNMSRLVGYLISDIMGDVTFSKSFDMQKKPDNRDLLSSLPQAVAGIHLVGYMPEIVTFGLHKIFFGQLIAGIARFTGLSASTFQWRFTQENCTDLFSALLQARDDKTGRGFSTDQLISEAGLLTVAGTDTTVTATTAIFFYLTHYLSCRSRLEKEIRSVFTNVEDIRIGPRLASCHYLLACIEETLRINPPVGSILVRELLSGGLSVDGEWFPPGTDIGVPHYALHHDEHYYPDPFTFKPQRWLAQGSSDAIDIEYNQKTTDDAQVKNSSAPESLAASAFSSFGVGRTSCIGKYLAYQEISLVVARTIWLFDMRLEPGSTLGEGRKNLGAGRQHPNEFQTLDRFVSMHEGPMLQFKRREF